MKETLTPRTWPIWIEGYSATGNDEKASFEGNWPGDTFREACAAWAASIKNRKVPYDPTLGADWQQYADRDDYDPERNEYWGCRLFDNEADARKFNG